MAPSDWPHLFPLIRGGGIQLWFLFGALAAEGALIPAADGLIKIGFGAAMLLTGVP